MAATATPYKEGELPSKEHSPTDQQLNIRLSAEHLSEIDLEIDKMQKQNPGLTVSRAEMGRILLLRGLKK